MIMSNQILNEKLCLCIDTSTKAASIALAKFADDIDVQIVYSVLLNDGLTHSEKLIPLIDQCFAAAGFKIEDVDLFACVTGPGSYTGLRIGISTANALAQSTGKDIIGITSLETLAYTFNQFDGLIVPMVDARRDEVYTAIFKSGDGFNLVIDECSMSVDEILQSIKDNEKNIIFAGDGSAKAKERVQMLFAEKAKFASGIANQVNAAIGVELAVSKYLSSDNKAQKVILPNYIKETSAKTQAERNKQGKK